MFSKTAQDFIRWTKLKTCLHFSNKQSPYFSEREIWCASMGLNIGVEEDGKNDLFE